MSNEFRKEDNNSLETVIYGLSSLSLLGVLALSIAQKMDFYSNVIAIYWIIGLFVLLILFYSYYIVRMILQINEAFGKKSYIGLTIFYVGFLSILWTVSSIVVSKLFSKSSWEITGIPRSYLQFIIMSGTETLMIYLGLGLGVIGIILDITNIDDYFLYPLVKAFSKRISGIYKFIRTTLIFNTFVVFFVAKYYCPEPWPYSPLLFAFLVSFIWINVFNPKAMVTLFQLIKQNIVLTLNIGGSILIVSGLFVNDKLIHYVLIGAGIIIIAVANSKTLIRWFSVIANHVYEVISSYPLETLSIFLIFSGIMISILFFVLGFSSYYGLIIILLGILIKPKMWYKILINSLYKIHNTPELNIVFHLSVIFVIVILLMIGIENKNVVLLSLAGVFTVGLIGWDYNLIVKTWSFIRNIAPIIFKYLRGHLRELFRVLKGFLTAILWLNILITVGTPKIYHGYALHVMTGSLLLIALLEYDIIIEEPRKTINSVASLFLFFFLLDYLVIVRTTIYLYLALAMFVILFINSSKKFLDFISKFGKALYRMLIVIFNWFVRITKRLGKLVVNYFLVFVYLILELLLIVYALWIIFNGDPLHILSVKTFADRLSMGGGILLLALASNLLLADKIKLFFKQVIYSSERRLR